MIELDCFACESKVGDYNTGLCEDCTKEIGLQEGEHAFYVSLREGNKLFLPAKHIADVWQRLEQMKAHLEQQRIIFDIDGHGFLKPGDIDEWGVYVFRRCPVNDPSFGEDNGNCFYAHFEQGKVVGRCDIHHELVLDFCGRNCEPCQHRLECIAVQEA